MSGMTREHYNALVQDMQEFCLAAGLEFRVEGHRNSEGDLALAQFDVYYGGWHTVGLEYRPMRPDTERSYNEGVDARVRAMVAHDIAK